MRTPAARPGTCVLRERLESYIERKGRDRQRAPSSVSRVRQISVKTLRASKTRNSNCGLLS